MLEGAKWVGGFGEEAPKIRGQIYIPKNIEKAEIEICGLGTFRLYINGSSVTDEVFPMLWSDYHKRLLSDLQYKIEVNTTHRIYVPRYDITEYIKEGKNSISVLLGNGWYNQYERVVEGNMSYGKPVLCYRITVKYRDGQCEYFVSNETLKWQKSHITYNNLYLGETQDLRLYDEQWKMPEFDEYRWENVEEIEIPETIYDLKKCDGDKRIRTLTPVLVAQKGDKRIYDCRENITGWIKVAVSGKIGQRVIVEYAEELYSDKTLNFESSGGEEQIQKDAYICSGKKMVSEPYFTWHSFRYFSIEGDGEPIECVVVHAPIRCRTDFECNEKVLNWIYDAYVRTQLNNMHMGVPSDCPHRERLGYTGDGQLTCGAAMSVLDADGFYRKWIKDIMDCQDIYTGRIQHTAPFYGGGGGNGGWGCAIVMVPYKHYKHFFDKGVLVETYPYMEKWIEYMFTQTQNNIVLYEEKDAEINPDYWNLGDWCTPNEVKIPKGFVNTYFLIKSLIYMQEIASIINQRFKYENKIIDLKEALKNKYFDHNTHTFCNSEQGADAFALDIDLGDEETEEQLLRKYSTLKNFDTGIFGTYILLNVLFERGYTDIAVNLMTANGKHTYYNMMQSGATTLWERWDGLWSHNHPMFGAIVELFIKYLLGVNIIDKENISIQPQFCKCINHIKATIKTNTGTVQLQYKINNDNLTIDLKKDCEENVVFDYEDEKQVVSEELSSFERKVK